MTKTLIGLLTVALIFSWTAIVLHSLNKKPESMELIMPTTAALCVNQSGRLVNCPEFSVTVTPQVPLKVSDVMGSVMLEPGKCYSVKSNNARYEVMQVSCDGLKALRESRRK